MTISTLTKFLFSIASVAVAIAAIYFTYYTSERTVQPAIVFFNNGGKEDKWGFKNVGSEPALNVVISYLRTKDEKWKDHIDRPRSFSAIVNKECFVILNIQGPDSLIAEYEDIKGNLWTTIINDNKNQIKSISKRDQKFKTTTKQQWQLNPVKQIDSECFGIEV